MTAPRYLAICIGVYAVTALPAAVAPAAFPGENGRIAYNESRFKDADHGGPRWTSSFWSRRPNGTRPQRIVKHATSLSFSADGSRVVFTRAAGIGLARAAGLGRSWLLGHAPVASDPYWGADWAAFSPDAAQITFHVHENDPFPYGPNLYVIGVDGANPRRIAVDASHPVFSPDGSRIAYIRHILVGEGETHPTGIETMAVDGTDRRTLVPARTHPNFWVYHTRVDFAPSGTQLLAVESRDNIQRIMIIDAETGERKRLPARVTGRVLDAVWSPDGRRLAYINQSSNRVFTIRPNGTGKRLAFTVALSRYRAVHAVAWQPRP